MLDIQVQKNPKSSAALGPALGDFCGIHLRVLPDFLLDHSLLHAHPEGRLPEVCARWVQLVDRLSAWGEKAMFCLRFDGRPDRGTVAVYLLARPPSAAQRDLLQNDLEFALRTYGVIGEEVDYGRYLPLLTAAQIDALALGSDAKKSLAADVAKTFGAAFAAQPHGAFVGVTQRVTSHLWRNETVMKQLTADPRLLQKGQTRDDIDCKNAWMPLSFEGPSGPFVLPFKALFAARSPLRISIYLQPCVVEKERLWLEKVAQGTRQDGNKQDPVVDLAGRRAASATRRLINSTFMTAAECVAIDGDGDAAWRLAEVMRVLSREVPAGVPESDSPMPDARVITASGGNVAVARASHAAFAFPNWMDEPGLPHYAVRQSYLADARGAATFFRLPISVRGGVPGVEVMQPTPDFNPGPRPGETQEKPAPIYHPPQVQRQITIGRFATAGEASVPVDDLTKHALVVGFTGTGKTKTVLHLLQQLWVDHRIPFLVMESAKSEYRGLLGMRDFQKGDGRAGLKVFTAGNQNAWPLRINPFELLPGVRVEAHISRLQTCFEAALPPFGPLASILEESLIEVYRDADWRMTDCGPPRQQRDQARFPCMSDFADKLTAIGNSRGYQGEFKATLEAAIKGRIRPLTRVMGGSKGEMLDTPRSWPPVETLFDGPVVLEMNDLNGNDKALLCMFLLTLIREHREQQHGNDKLTGLRHVTVIEEAHNVLQNVSSSAGGEDSGAADTRYQAVQAFCGMLAEIRSYGEGVIIADQSPLKLAPDAMRNTNLQIAHQLRDTRDRLAIANAMIMTDEQRDYLGRLLPGRAGLFYTGLQKASFVTVPRFDDPDPKARGFGFAAQVTDKTVAEWMRGLEAGRAEPERPYDGCRDCPSRFTCDFRRRAAALTGDAALKQRFLALLAKRQDADVFVAELKPLLIDAVKKINLGTSPDAAWCFLLHIRHTWTAFTRGGPFDLNLRKRFVRWLEPAFRK
jgi:hypothetical protein